MQLGKIAATVHHSMRLYDRISISISISYQDVVEHNLTISYSKTNLFRLTKAINSFRNTTQTIKKKVDCFLEAPCLTDLK